ncbi:MAG: FAD-binding protein [Pseudomonadota bacterium]|nr:FAD-binding protein [Pseudomonadota bacterium]
MSDQTYAVVNVGAGNAALCTAISAKLEGTHVLVLEKAPEDEKGGNYYFTAGGFRFAHTGLDDVCQDVHVDLSGEHARGRYTAVAE